MTAPRRSVVVAAALGTVGWALVVGAVPPASIYAPLALYAAALTLIVGFLDRERLVPLLVPTPRALMFGVAGGVAMIIGTHLAFDAASALVPTIFERVQEDYATTDIAGNWRVVPMLLVVIVAEEVVWRGALLDTDRSTKWMIASVATYTFAQIGFGSWVVVVLAIVCGVVWSVERYLAKSIVAPLVTHAIWNVAVLVADPVIAP